MLLARFLIWMLPLGLAVSGAGVVSGQNYPNRPIRIVTSEPGGGADSVTRVIAQGLTVAFGQQVIVDNRGGSAIIPAGIVAKAPPDGHTLLLSASLHWLLPFLQDKVPYDPVKDFLPISLTTSSPSVLVVHPSVAVHSVKELIALARSKPGELNYASGAIGSTTHLSTELFKVMAGVNVVRVPYKGAAPALNGLIGGEAQMMFITATSVMPHVRSGRLRALGVASAQPSALAPGLPTVAASGVAGYASGTTHGVFAPARTPETIIGRLYKEIARFLNRADMKEKLFNSGLEVIASSPAQLAATVKSDMATMGKMIKDARIRAD